MNRSERITAVLSGTGMALLAPGYAYSSRRGLDWNPGWWLPVASALGMVLLRACDLAPFRRGIRPKRGVPVAALSLNQLAVQQRFAAMVDSIDILRLHTLLEDQPELEADEPYGRLERPNGGLLWTPHPDVARCGARPIVIEAQEVLEWSVRSSDSVENRHWMDALLNDGAIISFKVTRLVLRTRRVPELAVSVW